MFITFFTKVYHWCQSWDRSLRQFFAFIEPKYSSQFSQKSNTVLRHFWYNSLLLLNQNLHQNFHKSLPLLPVLRQIDLLTPLFKPFRSSRIVNHVSSHDTQAQNLDQLIPHSIIWRRQAVKFPCFGIYSILLLTSCLLNSHFVISNF
jgi:hypothetical protein